MRSWAEHFNLQGNHALNSTRNIYLGPIESFLFGPHNVGHHITHHLYPQIPYFALPKMTAELGKESGFNSARVMADGYLVGGKNSVINQLSTVSA